MRPERHNKVKVLLFFDIGGSIEYSNDEAGAVWMRRMLDVYPKAIWLNPEPEQLWPYRQSISVIREIMESRMHPITGPGARDALPQQVVRWPWRANSRQGLPLSQFRLRAPAPAARP